MNAIDIAAMSMNFDVQRMNSISHNLANGVTTAFKKTMTVGRTFADQISQFSAVTQQLQTLPIALPRAESSVDMKAGTLRFTGNHLDLAIESDGFFEIASEQGNVYTRKGNFQLDNRGRLVTENGLPVAGISGDIILSSTQPAIDGSGAVFEAGKQVAQLKVVRFSNADSMTELQPGVYAPGQRNTQQQVNLVRVRQGYLESSNVNSMNEMVRMIETMRHFESNQRVIQAYDEMLDNAIRKLGEF